MPRNKICWGIRRAFSVLQKYVNLIILELSKRFLLFINFFIQRKLKAWWETLLLTSELIPSLLIIAPRLCSIVKQSLSLIPIAETMVVKLRVKKAKVFQPSLRTFKWIFFSSECLKVLFHDNQIERLGDGPACKETVATLIEYSNADIHTDPVWWNIKLLDWAVSFFLTNFSHNFRFFKKHAV